MQHCDDDNEAAFRVSGKESPDSLVMPAMVKRIGSNGM